MNAVRKILFPIDFSNSTAAMRPFVERAAALFGASVTLLHVIDPRSLNLSEDIELSIRPLETVLEDHRQAQSTRLDDFAGFVDSEWLLLDGDAATAITAYAKRQGFDLIVMPTHSGRFAQRLLGSTTAHVINRAECPVLTSRHAESVHASPLDHKHWVCALDLTPYAGKLLERATSLSSQAGAAVYSIHVIDAADAQAHSTEGLHQTQETSDRFQTLLSQSGLKARGEVAVGPLRATLVRALEVQEADLLIVGRSGSNPASGRMSDFTYTMVRDSPVPVLSI